MTRPSHRIGGLAAGQDLLVRKQWQGVDVRDLVESQLAHFKGLIDSKVSFLATSRRGYRRRRRKPSAWRCTNPRLTTPSMVRCQIVLNSLLLAGPGTGAEPEFSISWKEAGGSAMRMPARNGFGQVAIGRMTEAAVQGIPMPSI